MHWLSNRVWTGYGYFFSFPRVRFSSRPQPQASSDATGAGLQRTIIPLSPPAFFIPRWRTTRRLDGCLMPVAKQPVCLQGQWRVGPDVSEHLPSHPANPAHASTEEQG